MLTMTAMMTFCKREQMSRKEEAESLSARQAVIVSLTSSTNSRISRNGGKEADGH